MARFADLTLSAFLDALASAEPTPGGGTASAVSAAMGASLLMMVAGLPKSRANTDAERRQLADASAALGETRARLMELADADSEAYDQVVAAYRLPKATDDDKAARTTAIQAAMRAATEAPLHTLHAATRAAALGRVVAHCAHPPAASDVRVGLELIEAGAAGAAANVEINLSSLRDENFKRSAATDVLDNTNQLSEDLAAARAALKDQAAAS